MRVVIPGQPAASVVPVAPAAIGTARDPEAERLWAEIDRLAKEFLEIGAEIERPPPAPPVPPVVVADVPPSPAVAASTPSFPLAYGERAMVTDVDLLANDPLADDAARKSLEAWAELLTANPAVQVVLLAHVDGGDRDANLRRSTELAIRLRDYLLVAGAPQGSVVALGMGSAEPVVGWEAEEAQRANTRLEIERLR